MSRKEINTIWWSIKSLLQKCEDNNLFIPSRRELQIINRTISSNRIYNDFDVCKFTLELAELFKSRMNKLWPMAISPIVEDSSEFWSPCSREKAYDSFGEFIENSHYNNFQSLQKICKNYKDGIIGIFDGKVKSMDRAIYKASQNLICNDISRARIVFRNLHELWINFSSIVLSLQHKWYHLALVNNYYDSYSSRYNTNRKWINTTRTYMSKEWITNPIKFEIQFVTINMNISARISHPFEVSKIIEYDNKYQRDDLAIFMTLLLMDDFFDEASTWTYINDLL